MADIFKEIEEWAPFPETAELNRLKQTYSVKKETWEVKENNYKYLVEVARLEKETWEAKEEQHVTKLRKLAGANRGLADRLLESLREKEHLQDLITEL